MKQLLEEFWGSGNNMIFQTHLDIFFPNTHTKHPTTTMMGLWLELK